MGGAGGRGPAPGSRAGAHHRQPRVVAALLGRWFVEADPRKVASGLKWSGLLVGAAPLAAQGVTTGAVTGTVTDNNGAAVTFGLGGHVLFPFRIGASTVLVERTAPDELLAAIEQYRATVCFTAPTAYRATSR